MGERRKERSEGRGGEEREFGSNLHFGMLMMVFSLSFSANIFLGGVDFFSKRQSKRQRLKRPN